MAPPTWSVGEVLTASDVNSWFVPLAAYRTSTQSVTASTVYVNDTALVVAVAANAVYDVQIALNYDGNAAGDLKLQWALPAGAAISGSAAAALIGTAASSSDDITWGGGTGLTVGCIGTGTTAGLLWSVLLTTSSTSGNMQLQWAQATSSASATNMFAGSRMTALRVG